MILTSNRGFAERGEVFGHPVVATALLDRLPHHAVLVQIGGASYCLRAHADLIPEHTRAHAAIMPPPPPRAAAGRGKTETSITDRLITDRRGGKSCLGTSGEIQIGIYTERPFAGDTARVLLHQD
jgi:IstB-like ATP binding protein